MDICGLQILNVLAMLTLVVLGECVSKHDQKQFLTNPKGLDYIFKGKKDAHRFGVELKENQQFHHTITGLCLSSSLLIYENLT
jgi:hypothetical protein